MKRLSVIWPVVMLVASGLWFFQSLNALPDSVSDMLRRSAPALLVIIGLMMLIGRRVRFGNLVAILLTVVLLVGVGTVAYSRQQAIVRNDYISPFETVIQGSVTSVRIILTTRQTDIEIVSAAAGNRTVSGNYTGSIESQVTVDYAVDGAIGTFNLSETQRNTFPALELVGRGKLTLSLPAGVTIEELTIKNEGGALTLDSSTNAINKLSVELANGDINATFAEASGMIGDLRTGGGGITVTIPPTITARVTLKGGGAGSAQFDPNRFIEDTNLVLQPVGGQAQIQLSLDAPGTLVVQ
ncbi:MAG: hypothetical protein KF716_21815 [Anaerolineae bacterium]|nr:hypothetical protein [Anaerolineae bacterium]